MAEQAGGEGAVERILRMVSEGKLSPEQGATLLRALTAGTGQALPGGDDARGEDAAPEEAKSDGRGRFRYGRGRGVGVDSLGIDLAHLGRIGRQVARRVERELDQLERSARRGWFEEDGDGDGSDEELWRGPAPAHGRLELDVEVDNAGVRVVPDATATEVRVLYRAGVVHGIGAEGVVPRVHMDGDRLVVRQRHRGLHIGFSLGDERLTVRVPAAVTAVAGVVHSHNGAVRVEGVDADRLELRATNGACRLRAARAVDVDVQSMNGRVEVDVASAHSVRAASRNGRLDIEGTIERVDADADNGKMVARIGALSADSTWRLSAGNGRLEIYLPPAPAGLRGQVRSAVGGVDADLDATRVEWLGRGPVGAEAELARPAGPGAATLTLEARATNGRIVLAEPSVRREAGPEAASV